MRSISPSLSRFSRSPFVFFLHLVNPVDQRLWRLQLHNVVVTFSGNVGEEKLLVRI